MIKKLLTLKKSHDSKFHGSAMWHYHACRDLAIKQFGFCKIDYGSTWGRGENWTFFLVLSYY